MNPSLLLVPVQGHIVLRKMTQSPYVSADPSSYSSSVLTQSCMHRPRHDTDGHVATQAYGIKALAQGPGANGIATPGQPKVWLESHHYEQLGLLGLRTPC